jgi:hypothetical protein
MGPKVAAMKDLMDFDRRFAQKLYGPAFNADMRSMAMALALSPALGKAMKEYYAHQSSFTGTPIRTSMRFETVTGTDQPKQQTADNDDSSSSSPASAVIGGLFNKMKQRQAERKAEDAPQKSSDPNRSQIFDSSTELIKASAAASAADVAIPAGFKQR